MFSPLIGIIASSGAAAAVNIDLLIVAGGAGGGGVNGSGIIGGGGSGTGVPGNNGGDTTISGPGSFVNITAIGGGGGGAALRGAVWEENTPPSVRSRTGRLETEWIEGCGRSRTGDGGGRNRAFSSSGSRRCRGTGRCVVGDVVFSCAVSEGNL